MMFAKIVRISLLAAFMASGHAALAERPPAPQWEGITPGGTSFWRERSTGEEIIYRVLVDRFSNGETSNDTGEISGNVYQHGHYPLHASFFHGGDLAGLEQRIDYLRELGVTALWLTPLQRNLPVQGERNESRAGYMGRWVIDFVEIDPRWGTERTFRNFVQRLHENNIKIYLDIVVNNTADINKYRECHDENFSGAGVGIDCPYREFATHPFTRRAGEAETINEGFMGDDKAFRTLSNFSKLNDPGYAYTPYKEGKAVKNPDWLNELRHYNNRGNATDLGEGAIYGDVDGLDDLMTTSPTVVGGLTEIYKSWISRFDIDGFHILDAQRVDTEFLAGFVQDIKGYAREQGNSNFTVFAATENSTVAEQAALSQHVSAPVMLDKAFSKVMDMLLIESKPTIELAKFLDMDVLYANQEAGARQMPVMISGYDIERFAGRLRRVRSGENDTEAQARIRLAYAVAMLLRGAPVIYYGDEQGFVSDGPGDFAAEDMLDSKVLAYNDNRLVGTKDSTSQPNFNIDHPIFLAISQIARIRSGHKALQTGELKVRFAEEDGGVFAFSRFGARGDEYLVAFNTRNEQRILNINTDPRSKHFSSIFGTCAPRPLAVGNYPVQLPAFGLLICQGQ